eukprot:9450849-Alexandrium_andersonii.AAC.1
MKAGDTSTEAVVEEAPPSPPATDETITRTKAPKPAPPCAEIPLEQIGDEHTRDLVQEWREVVKMAIEQENWAAVRDARLCA